MLFLDVYNKNVYIGTELIGYVNHNGAIFVNGKRILTLKSNGDLYVENYFAGYIDDDNGDIYLKDRLVSHLTANNDIYLSPKQL